MRHMWLGALVLGCAGEEGTDLSAMLTPAQIDALESAGFDLETLDAASLRTYEATNTGDGALEGHTPQGFEGMGDGLFAADEINPGFPAGDATQVFVTLPLDTGRPNRRLAGADRAVINATLSVPTANVTIQGDPYAELGPLVADPVTFDTFSAALWDLAPNDASTGCTLASSLSDGISCDLTAAVQQALDAGETSLQLRIRFDGLGTANGAPDGVYFDVDGDLNTPDPDTFSLVVEAVDVVSED